MRSFRRKLGMIKFELRKTKLEFRKTKFELRKTKLEFRKTKLEFRKTKLELRKTKLEFSFDQLAFGYQISHNLHRNLYEGVSRNSYYISPVFFEREGLVRDSLSSMEANE